MKTISKVALFAAAFIVTGSVFAETRQTITVSTHVKTLSAPEVVDFSISVDDGFAFETVSNSNHLVFSINAPATLSYNSSDTVNVS